VQTVITESAVEAAEFIRRGGIVAFPTETVYGLGADAFNEAAVQKIFGAKGRPADNPLIVHISRIEQVDKLSSNVTENARKFIEAFFPGPMTVVLKKTDRVPMIATAGLETVGIRMPRNAVAKEFLAECATPVAAPSANLSGRPSPTTWQAVQEDLNGRIDCILKGEPTEIGLESTVVDCTGAAPVLLRAGAVSLEDLRRVVPETSADVSDASQKLRSPGVRHEHYKPSANVILTAADESGVNSERASYIGLVERREQFVFVKICNSVDEYAHELFEFFRECDRRQIQTIYCEKVPEAGIGRALMDRLRRAADV
jgi:L-threonylcarbamoyladenylate synthase